VPYAFHVLNAFWLTRLAGTADHTIPTETFDTHVACGAPNRTSLDVALEITKHHRTQQRDMGRVRSLRPQLGELFLERFDPNAQHDPLEPPH
jgi:hypothetical protein